LSGVARAADDRPLPSPTAAHGAEASLALAEVYRELHNRLRLLVNLRVDALDRMALQHELETIGSPYII
jgi:hypothetical protein